MTLEEARKIAAVSSEADGGSPSCVSMQQIMLAGAFPEFDWFLHDEKTIGVIELGASRDEVIIMEAVATDHIKDGEYIWEIKEVA